MVQTKEKELDKAAPANARELHLLHVTVRELGTLLGLEVLVLPEIASVLEMIQGQLRLAREFFTMKQVETMMNCCSMALSYAETCGVLQEEGDELLVIYPLSFNIYEVFFLVGHTLLGSGGAGSEGETHAGQPSGAGGVGDQELSPDARLGQFCQGRAGAAGERLTHCTAGLPGGLLVRQQAWRHPRVCVLCDADYGRVRPDSRHVRHGGGGGTAGEGGQGNDGGAGGIVRVPPEGGGQVP